MSGFKTGIDAIQSSREYQYQIGRRVDAERLMREHYGIKDIKHDGEELRCRCPLPFGLHKHGDRTGKFSINSLSGVCGCWVCGGGNLLWFVMSMEDISESEALGVLRRYQRQMTDEEFEQVLRDNFKEQNRHEVKEINSMAQGADEYVSDWTKNPHEYWRGRGFSSETIAIWRLGYDPAMNRVVVPHYFNGSLVGWQKRILPPDEVSHYNPKWTSSDDFPAMDSLFNMDGVKGYPSVIVVEAALSAIWLHQCGIPNVVSTFGSGVGKRQAELLRRFDDVILWFDPDEAGWKGALKLHDMLSGHTNVWMVDSWDGDPNEIDDGVVRPAEDCWQHLYGQPLIPSYMFDGILFDRLDRVTYDGIHKVRRSRIG